jgi:hypothetical protein
MSQTGTAFFWPAFASNGCATIIGIVEVFHAAKALQIVIGGSLPTHQIGNVKFLGNLYQFLKA